MIIDVRTIPAGHSVLSQETGLEAQKDDLPKILGKVLCRAEIDRNGAELHIHLQFEVVLELECSRCCTPFAWPIIGSMRLVLKERQDRHGAASEGESDDFFYTSSHLDVDLGGAIYEEIITEIPLKPLCAEECKGIEILSNPVERIDIDPRWEALKKLKNR
jgi:uncharacterized protein